MLAEPDLAVKVAAAATGAWPAQPLGQDSLRSRLGFLSETAERERRRGGLAAEARRLMADDAYVKEALEVAELMEQLRGTR